MELTWTLTNQGDGTAAGTWNDQVFLSEDSSVGGDQLFGTFSFSGILAPGQSIERRQVITLPITLEGERYVIVRTDANNQIFELSNEGNNTGVDDQVIEVNLSPFPNLQVESVTAPPIAFSSQETVIEWTVTNTGNGATSAPSWFDRVWLSLDSTLDNTDTSLGQVINPSYLNAGESYSNRLTVTLPRGIQGNYYFIVQTDSNNRVFEFNNEEDNRGVGGPTDVNLTPPPDLQVTTVNAPAQAFSGQPMSLTWTVSNEGEGRTLETNWADEIYLSADSVLDGGDVFLGRQFRNIALNAGERYSV